MKVENWKEQKLEAISVWIILGVFAGIVLRYIVMSIGHNYDFESYCIVGELVVNGKNVYAETGRYNYGFLFSLIQGGLYRLASVYTGDLILSFRILMVGVLTLADLGIAVWIMMRHSVKMGLIFFLNPISVIITGYHNQFDNIAIVLALYSCLFYNEEEKIGKKDWMFVLLLSTSLITKHIMFMLPMFLLLKRGLKFKKRILYSCFPPAIFLLSFVPYALGNPAALEGILNNVFLYRSFNNVPLFRLLYESIGVPERFWFPIYLLILALYAWFVRKQTYEYQLVFYLLIMVTFSVAISNQYLIIPIVALCLLDKGLFRYGYFAYGIIFLLMNANGLGLANRISENQTAIYKLAQIIAKERTGCSYVIFAGILFMVVLKETWRIAKENMERAGCL